MIKSQSTGTIGKRLEKVGLENTEEVRRAYREVLLTTQGLGESISGVILFKETLAQSTITGKTFVDCLEEANIYPGIKVDEVSLGHACRLNLCWIASLL
jgi:fructose-bisphosphate aldolase class I